MKVKIVNSFMKIKDKCIGENNPAYIIAEMSANHAGDFKRAIEIINAAKESGADCIKIQTYTPDTMTINSDKEYFKIVKGTWKGENLYKLYEKAYTPWEWQGKLKEEAEKIGIDFLSTPFDKTSVDFLESIGVSFYKVASFELTDIPLIKYIASKEKPIILSTGMGTLREIEEAVKMIRSQGNNNFCILRCSSAYPAIPDDMNLKTINHLKETFGVPVGLSDHSLGSVGAITAVAMGAKIIEKHFCISREIENPDSSFSMEPREFKKMVEDIRAAEKALGKVSYEVSPKEEINKIFRRSIFVVKDIKKGERFTEDNIRVIRPAYGLEPKYYEEIIGKIASMDIEIATPLNWSMVT
jgi:pseudaminic acid synthase